jgi:outer membrane lipoprotein-sorting protein
MLSSGPAAADPLADVLARVDRGAQQFKSVSAKMKRLEYTAVIDDSSQSTGQFRMKREKGSLVAVLDFQEPEPRTIHLNGREVQVYYPKANTVEIYDAGKNASTLDQFVLLGFGTTSAALMRDYEVSLGGVETLGQVRTSRLELTPKSAEVKKLVTKIELWIPEDGSNPVQEKVNQPSRNYTLINYSDIKVNPSLPDTAFQVALPPGVKKIRPQK